MELIQKHADKLRFALIGGLNTLLDFALLFLFTHLGLPVIIANLFSTSVAFIFSFFANRSFTFKATGGNAKRQFILFLVVTLFGLWVLQPIVITLTGLALGPTGLSSDLTLLIGKLLATAVSLTWNYIFYSRLVFKKES